MTGDLDTATTAGGSRGISSDDWDLIRQVGTGDQAALEILYKRYYPYLYRFVFQITRRGDFIDEVINEVMFVVWEKAARVVPLAKASTWILGIAHNKALQVMHRGRPLGDVEPEQQISLESGYAGGDTALRELETAQLMFRMLGALSPEQRAVMELVYYHGLHYSEIARLIDCPESTVKTRVFHARKKLRAVWPEFAGKEAPDTKNIRDR